MEKKEEAEVKCRQPVLSDGPSALLVSLILVWMNGGVWAAPGRERHGCAWGGL